MTPSNYLPYQQRQGCETKLYGYKVFTAILAVDKDLGRATDTMQLDIYNWIRK